MNERDTDWMLKCMLKPDEYKVYVDNDEIFVIGVNKDGSDGDEVLYTFSRFGEEFIIQFLRMLGVNIDYV